MVCFCKKIAFKYSQNRISRPPLQFIKAGYFQLPSVLYFLKDFYKSSIFNSKSSKIFFFYWLTNSLGKRLLQRIADISKKWFQPVCQNRKKANNPPFLQFFNIKPFDTISSLLPRKMKILNEKTIRHNFCSFSFYLFFDQVNVK